jgi:uncharacterized protein YjiK
VKYFTYLSCLCLACAPAGSSSQVGAPSLALYDFERQVALFEMPGRLDEISGLAMTTDGRLFGHNDERATVNEIDRATGLAGKRFSVGDPPLEGDFEGLAIAGERFFLITSLGLLYEFREVGDRETAPHRVTDTRLGAICEIEGLDYDASEDVLLIACKVSTPDRGTIVVHRLPLDPSRAPLEPISIARAQITTVGLNAGFQPSSVAVSPSGTLYLASAATEALIEVARDGRVLAGHRLDRDRHRQSEGLAFGPDGTLFIADERNRETARITLYRRLPATGERP